jgi:hypothetical protein
MNPRPSVRAAQGVHALGRAATGPGVIIMCSYNLLC